MSGVLRFRWITHLKKQYGLCYTHLSRVDSRMLAWAGEDHHGHELDDLWHSGERQGFLDRKIRTERGVWWMELCQGSWVDCYYRTVTSMEVVSYARRVMVQKQKNILVKTRHFTIRHYHTHPYYPVHRHLCILGPGSHGQRYPWSSSVVPGLPGPLSPSCNRNELLPLQTYTKDDNERTKEEEDIISM